ncbi:unnamed protein product [Durusdinium trenchii]|uniref:Uncharacterized protein n=1 Tax=Durusdinium trenchii TaxID=1381693 RepID=A0ABP0HLL0_9DINO
MATRLWRVQLRMGTRPVWRCSSRPTRLLTWWMQTATPPCTVPLVWAMRGSSRCFSESVLPQTFTTKKAEKALLEQALDEERQEVQKLQAEKQSLEHALDEAQKQARDKAALASKSEVQKLQAEKQSLEHALDEAQKQVPLLPTMTDQSQQRHASDLAEQWAEVEHARFDLEQRERDLAFRDFALRRSEVRHRESERRQSAMRRRLEDFRVELEEAMADVAAHEEFLRKQRRRTAEAHAHARQMLDAARRMSTEVTGGLSHSVRSRSARSAHR